MIRALRRRVRTLLEERLDVPTIPRTLDRLVRLGFSPAGILDVGANRGDFARLCRLRWPSAELICFEPLPERVAELQAWAATTTGVTIMPTLLGERLDPRVPLHHDDTASSVLIEPQWSADSIHEHPMTTLDALEPHLPAPDLIKLDVQGYELAVLEGGVHTLSRAKALITEVSVLDLQPGVHLVADLIQWLAARRWVTYDVSGILRRPLDRALWQMDVVFVPVDSPLRTDKRWST